MRAPQVIWIALAASDVTLALVKNGELKGRFHFGHTLGGVLLVAALLWWGGFFSQA